MSTEAQIAASRANGAKSKGPVTPGGKATSSQNATRPGLFARLALLEGEDREDLFDTYQEHVDRFQPRDKVELNLVEHMVFAQWRLYRVWIANTRDLQHNLDAADPGNHELDLTAACVLSQVRHPEFAALNAYEKSLDHSYHRALRSLLLLRKETQKLTKRTQEVVENKPEPESASPCLCDSVVENPPEESPAPVPESGSRRLGVSAVNPTPTPATVARVELSSEPEGAAISLNGYPIPETTPISIDILPGIYTIAMKKDGLRASRQLSLGGGELHDVHLALL